MSLALNRLAVRRNHVGTVGIGSGSRTGTALNAAYVHGTSGPAIAIRYMAQTTDTIDELYLYVDSLTGSGQTMAADIYNESTNAARAGATLRDSATAVALPGSVGWAKFTFGSPYTPAVGEILWIVVYNTTGTPTSNYETIVTATNFFPQNSDIGAGVGEFAPYTTTTGWTTNGATQVECPWVVKQGSNYFGQPFTQRNAGYYTNNTRERGFQFTCDEDIVVSSVAFQANTNYTDFRILADATAPGGTALNTYDLDSDTNMTTCDICGGRVFGSQVTLSGGVTYKATFLFGANQQTPDAFQIEDYATYSSMFDTMRAYDTMAMPWGAISDGAGGWTIDKAIAPIMAMPVVRYPAIDTPLAENVTEDDTVRGVTGTYNEATVGEVVSPTAFGAASALTGTYPTTATSQAAQHATDAAFLEAHKVEIIPADTNILAEFGVTGTAAAGGGGPVMGGMVVR